MNAFPCRPVAAHPAASPRVARGVWPRVSVHLPLRDAPPELVRRTLDSLADLDYPALEVLVVDTNTAQPALWEAAAEHCARLGPPFRFFHLGPWPGGRPGALNFALGETAPDATLVGVLKAGQVVRPGWLRRMVPMFRQPGLGLAQGALAPLEPAPDHFVGQERPDPLLPLDGLPLFRAEALRRTGGWDTESLCPEASLGLTLLRQGWDTLWEDEPMGHARPPQGMEDWPARRHRRAAGIMAALRRHSWALLRRDRSLTPGQWRHLLGLAAPMAADALALSGACASLAVAARALWQDDPVAPPPLLLPLLLAVAMVPLLRGWRQGWPAALGHAAGIWGIGRAAWQGVLGGASAGASGHRMERALLAALWAASLAIALARPWSLAETVGWSGLLLVQSLPGLAALAVRPARPPGQPGIAPFRRHTA
ncbi:glycosyltransferase [Roseomonas marmotae]|uniref:Glycosyltransferase n=1 Tax=Roseomonas marmotae TaxID=2768161 RepID=A0ABS3KEG2_9PROT|nr:glycosyltransferase [Roseomonas marmotae]MBO1075392.1 glycosyltransferase [Roseomonas marmotae]QTI78381.1 glycosyltransferase [Roseomonas marmotae]